MLGSMVIKKKLSCSIVKKVDVEYVFRFVLVFSTLADDRLKTNNVLNKCTYATCILNNLLNN